MKSEFQLSPPHSLLKTDFCRGSRSLIPDDSPHQIGASFIQFLGIQSKFLEQQEGSR